MSQSFLNRQEPIGPETIENAIRRAKIERAQAIADLFGFGYTVVKDMVSSVKPAAEGSVGRRLSVKGG